MEIEKITIRDDISYDYKDISIVKRENGYIYLSNGLTVIDLQDQMMEPLNGNIDVLTNDGSEFSVLHIAVTKDLFDMIPTDWLHDNKELKNYLYANEREISFLENTFCIDADKLTGYDYIRIIIKER